MKSKNNSAGSGLCSAALPGGSFVKDERNCRFEGRRYANRRMPMLLAIFAMILVAGCGSVGGGKSGGSGGGSGSGSGGAGGGSGSGGGGSNSGVVIAPTGANVRIGATQQFTATVTGAANNDVTWS